MMRKPRGYFLIVPVALLVAWYLLALFKVITPLLLPSPVTVFLKMISLLSTGEILPDIGFTLYRALVGFILACIIGIPLGLVMGYSNKIYSSFEFIVEFFRSIPATALFPLFILAFGVGDESKIAITAWSAGLVMVINSMYGVHLSKELRLKAARTFKIDNWTLFRKIIFPEALPQIFTGIRVAISLALVVVVVTEMFIGTLVGLGYRIINAQLVYNGPEMYAAILIAGVVGFALNKGFMYLERKVVHWKGK